MNLHHPTTHKRPAFKVPPTQPAPSVLEAAANSIKDVLGTDTHVRISVTEFAQLAEDRRKLQAVEAILRANEPTWTPTHKAAAALMYLDNKPIGNVIPSSHDPNTLAATLNIDVGTARKALHQMATAKVLDYDSKATPVNRYGEPLEHGVKMNKTHGDRFKRVVTITLPNQPVIKPLAATPAQEKDKAAKKQQRDELRELRTKLAALECPKCGQVGHLQIVCGECGCKLDATLETSESEFSVIETPAATNDIAETIAAATNDIRPYTDDEREQLQAQWDEARQRNIEAVQKWIISAATPDKSESDFSRTPATIAPTDETPCEQYAIGPAAADELHNELPTTPATPEPAAAAAASLEKSDSDVSKVLAVATLETSKIDVCNKENSKFDVSTFGTERRVTHDEPPPTTNERDVNPPAANISPAQLTQLLGNEVRYIAAKYHSKQRANSGPTTWLNSLAALDALEKGHNITLDSAGQFAIIDIDAGAGEFTAPPNAPMIYRVNAPNRAKFIVRCDDVQTIAKRKNATGTREIEVKREAVVIGIHETGAQILCKHNGEPIPTMSMAQIDALVNSFVPAPTPTASANTVTPLSVPKAKPNTQTESDVKAAISWWNEQPANVAEVERLIASCPTKGKAFAIRDEKTPSTVYRPAQEKRCSPTWRDFGAGVSRDALDMYVLLTGCDKRRFIGEVMREWRAANIRPATPPTTSPAKLRISPNVAKWLEAATVGADDIIAGNPCWIPKREISSEDTAVLSAKLPAGIKLVDAGETYYQLRAE